jgi:hypothetical protein
MTYPRKYAAHREVQHVMLCAQQPQSGLVQPYRQCSRILGILHAEHDITSSSLCRNALSQTSRKRCKSWQTQKQVAWQLPPASSTYLWILPGSLPVTSFTTYPDTSISTRTSIVLRTSRSLLTPNTYYLYTQYDSRRLYPQGCRHGPRKSSTQIIPQHSDAQHCSASLLYFESLKTSSDQTHTDII